MTYKELTERFIKDPIRAVLSKPVKGAEVSSLKLRPVKIKNEILIQVTRSVGNKKSNTCKEIHENISVSDAGLLLERSLPADFLQALIECDGAGYTVLANKKGTVTVIKNKGEAAAANTEHNNKKKYLLPEGTCVPILRELGIMNADGSLIKAKYDKYRQINRYLEFVDDIMPRFADRDEITIIDFGCGKSYLTFALYYYLHEIKHVRAHIIGLDLKTDVIRECTRLKNKYGYDMLEFIEGDIEHFEGVKSVDMVISLHACDTATDYALYKALLWSADVIMAVPCCQHELNKTMNAPELAGITGYGLLKDRLASIITDAMRANILKEQGYDTDILEFIDMEHTPKNLLIRAVKRMGFAPRSAGKATGDLTELAGAEITLARLLEKKE